MQEDYDIEEGKMIHNEVFLRTRKNAQLNTL